MANLIYTPKDILQQEFKNKMRGYDPIEVDEFLDNVIKDYEAYNKQVLALQEENERLNAKVAQLSKAQTVSSRVGGDAKNSAVTNFDILKRLSNLEREVFGKKLDQQESYSGSYSNNSATPSDYETASRAEQSAAPVNSNYSNNENSSEMDKTRLF